MPTPSNPWGIPPQQARALDCLVLAGAPEPGTKMYGGNYGAFCNLVQRALTRIPGQHRLHKLIAWRDHRGLMQGNTPPATVVRFGVTDKQAQVLGMWCDGFSQRDIATALGVSRSVVYSRLCHGRARLPGERDGQKQAAWRRACTPGN